MIPIQTNTNSQKKNYSCGDIFIILAEEDAYWVALSTEPVNANSVGWSCEWLDRTDERTDEGCWYKVNMEETNVEYAWAHCCVGVLRQEGVHESKRQGHETYS